MCADGYQPQIVKNEATVYNSWSYPFQYFTCCPPNPSFDTNTSRHCSNATTLLDLNNNMNCEDDKRPYHRQMKNQSFQDDEVQPYICCDSFIDENQTKNFLDEIECVPYYNKDYYEPIPHNLYGSII